jgi:putative nucleotidyltransferase with HDIG domain
MSIAAREPTAAPEMNGASRILIVDDDPGVCEVLSRSLTAAGKSCDCFQDARSAIAALARGQYDLFLCDLLLPDMNGVELMRCGRSLAPDMAVVLITSVVDTALAVALLKEGASDYITKPFGLEEVWLSVGRALEKRRLVLENRRYRKTLEDEVVSRNRQLKEALEVLEHTYHSTLAALGAVLDIRGADSIHHSMRAAMYANRIGIAMGMSHADLHRLEQGALLHDVGKIGIPDRLLCKRGRLNESEWKVMREHPNIGFRILAGIGFLRDAAQIVLQHHERYDGTGYPSGFKGTEISRGARIFAVADTFECMTSHRPFQPASSLEAAAREIRRVSGSQLDPEAVDAFLQVPVEEWKCIRAEVASGVKACRPAGRLVVDAP